MSLRSFLVLAIILTTCLIGAAQTKEASSPSAKPAAANPGTEKIPPKTARELEAERLLKERRANAQSLLINLAADARSFNDMVTRGRTLARVASVLWNTDRERARTMFHQAWDAAEIADKDTLERARNEAQKAGADNYYLPPPIRREVIRLAARREVALADEFIEEMKEQMRRENGGRLFSTQGPLGRSDQFMTQRLDAARQLLAVGEVDKAIQFADPVLGVVSQFTVDFLSSVRERNATAADDRYNAMLSSAVASQLSDANTVSVLASYLFTPHIYVGFDNEGTYTNSHPGNRTPPQVSPQLRLAFFQATAAILLRPLAAPGEDRTTSGPNGQHLVIKRLMPLFEQYAPPELTASLKAQLETLQSLVSNSTLERDDDDWVKMGIRPDKMAENLEASLLDKLDHAKTSTERDKIYLQLASFYAGSGELRARDFVDKVADPEVRKNGRTYFDIRLAEYAVARKSPDRMLELTRNGELDHIYKGWLYAQAAKLLSKSDNEKATNLAESAVAEARRISPSDVEAPRTFLAAANAIFTVNRAAVWDTMNEAIRNANSAEKFTGEDGELEGRLVVKGGPNYGTHEDVPDFDLEGIFKNLADFDYDRAVQLARGFNRDATRSVATIAIARAILEQNGSKQRF
jgi:hypothetical protein